MKLIYSLLGLICFSFVIVSCQQGVNGDLPPNPNYNNDSTTLVRFAVIDTARPAGLDTIEVWMYDRDSRNRVNKVSYLGRERTNTTPDWEYSEVREFFYNGNDTLPYKMIGYYSGHGAAFRWDTMFFNYNGAIVSFDSLRYHETTTGVHDRIGTDVRRYTITGPTTVTMVRTFAGADVPNPITASCTETYVYTMTKANGNIVSDNFTMTGLCTGPFGGPTGGSGGNTSVTYDNNPNPFYEVSLKWPILDQPFINNPLFPEQKNNLITAASLGPGFTYTYNSFGYPVILRYNDPTLPGNYFKAIYFYKK